MPERHATSNKDSTSEMSKDTSSPVYESIKTKLSPPKSDSIENSNNSSLPKGSKVQTQTTESVVQYEPGVYVTLSSLPGGGNELRRVRFRYESSTNVYGSGLLKIDIVVQLHISITNSSVFFLTSF